tara:strand:- start:1314 stop:1895 length:582 start_codon:yes stop_codon:yes gene_type:complete
MTVKDITHTEGPNFQLNITLHTIILFVFLTTLFFIYISQQEEKSLNNELGSILRKQTKKTLDEISKQLKKTDTKLNKDKLEIIASELKKNSTRNQKFIKENHNELLRLSIGIIIILVVIFIILILYYKYIKKIELNLANIFIENMIIFGFASLIEFAFFFFVASNYIPVTPDQIATKAFNSISTNITNVLYST